MIITFSGVDGCGKSTLISLLKDKLSAYSNQQVILRRSRPSYLPILSSFVLGKTKAEERAGIMLPRKGHNKSVVSSYIRFFYYLSDYIVGGFLLRLKYPHNKYVILYDRYYFDYIVDPKRFNLVIDQKFVNLIYKLFIPKAEVNFFVFCNEELVLTRKNELQRNEIVDLNEGFGQLFNRNGVSNGFYVVENLDSPIENAVEEIINILKNDKKSFLLFSKN